MSKKESKIHPIEAGMNENSIRDEKKNAQSKSEETNNDAKKVDENSDQPLDNLNGE